MDKKEVTGSLKYLIKWENYKERTWEKSDNIPAFLKDLYEAKGPFKVPKVSCFLFVVYILRFV